MSRHIFKGELDLCFKADRDYLRGADIVNSTFDLLKKHFDLSQIEQVDCSFHAMARSKVDIAVSDRMFADLTGALSLLKFSVKGRQYYAMTSASDLPVACRGVYREDEIFEKSVLDASGGCITIDHGLAFTPLEQLDTMNKQLLLTRFPEIKRKWLFARVQLNRWLKPSYTTLTVKFEKRYLNKYTRSIVRVDGVEAGRLHCVTIEH
jgi:hypothetical protein